VIEISALNGWPLCCRRGRQSGLADKLAGSKEPNQHLLHQMQNPSERAPNHGVCRPANPEKSILMKNIKLEEESHS
jgi:hypothetical protein